MRSRYSLLIIISLVIGCVLGLTSTSAARVLLLPGEYKTIQEAIDTCLPGDQIRLAAGTYQENITFKSGVGIYGEDAKTTLITGSPWLSTPIATTADKCTLDGVTITGAKAGSKGAIYIKAGSPRISNCIVTDNRDSGIFIEEKATPIIEHNRIFKNYKSAINSINSAPQILANEIFDNKIAGIFTVGSNPQLKNNIRFKSMKYGIVPTNPFKQNIVDTANNPKKIIEQPQPAIIGNTLYNNKEGEILCHGSSPLIQENNISNRQGLSIILSESDAIIKKNQITSGGPPVIRIDSGNPIIEENTISGVFRFPILGESRQGSIKNNKIEITQGPLFQKQQEANQAESEAK